MLRVIINADDLGKDHETNLAIEKAFEDRCITSSTIMANSSTWEDVHRIVDNNPDASFGVHLNLSEGFATTQSEILIEAGIVDFENRFTAKARHLSLIDNRLKDAIYNEWDSQVMTIVEKEHIPITHFDGHHHIHMNSAYSDILIRLAKKYDIKWIRRKHNTWSAPSFKDKMEGIVLPTVICFPFIEKALSAISNRVKIKFANYKREIILAKTVSFTDYFNGYEQVISLIKKGCLPPQRALIELMCHPGHPLFVKEYEMVRKHTLEQLIQDVQLLSYKDV